jgi:hypothetical protein
MPVISNARAVMRASVASANEAGASFRVTSDVLIGTAAGVVHRRQLDRRDLASIGLLDRGVDVVGGQAAFGDARSGRVADELPRAPGSVRRERDQQHAERRQPSAVDTALVQSNRQEPGSDEHL